MDIQIEKAHYSDLNQIDTIESSLDHRILSYNVLSSTLNNDMYYYYLAKKDNITIGYIAAEFMIDHLDILSIAVLDKYKRNGVATSLLNKLLNISNQLNISNIFLEVRCNNIGAINFYEKNGFKKINTRKNYYKDTLEDAYIYEKQV